MSASEVKCAPHTRRHFTMRSIASRAEGVLIVPQGTLNLKPQGVVAIPWGFMSMSYEKDIFAVFAYEFELLHNRSFLVKLFAYAHGEIKGLRLW